MYNIPTSLDTTLLFVNLGKNIVRIDNYIIMNSELSFLTLAKFPFSLALVAREKSEMVIFPVHLLSLKKHCYYYKFILGKLNKIIASQKIKLQKISLSDESRLRIVFIWC